MKYLLTRIPHRRKCPYYNDPKIIEWVKNRTGSKNVTFGAVAIKVDLVHIVALKGAHSEPVAYETLNQDVSWRLLVELSRSPARQKGNDHPLLSLVD